MVPLKQGDLGGGKLSKKTYGHRHAKGFIDHELPERTDMVHMGSTIIKIIENQDSLLSTPASASMTTAPFHDFSMHLEDRKIQAKTLTSNVVKVTYLGWRFSIASWMANQIDTSSFLGKETPWEWKKSPCFHKVVD